MNIKNLCNNAVLVIDEQFVTLFSYETEILKLNKDNNLVFLTSNEAHFTKTTCKHINLCFNKYNIRKHSKKELLNISKNLVNSENGGDKVWHF